MASCGSPLARQVGLLVAVCVLACWWLPAAQAIYLHGTATSYARYPHWNACINASLQFDFRTTQRAGLLLYVDDGGRYDFIEVTHTAGRVRCILNIVDGRDGHVPINGGQNVNDGRWHRVQVRRHRMETILVVDGVENSRFAYGSDFRFGDQRTNSPVYIGGLPAEQNEDLHALALPSVLFRTRFKGSIRNVVYGNCSCERTRADVVMSVGASDSPREACARRRHTCRDGCLCMSTDTDATCDCSDQKCVKDNTVTHYRLPMDILLGKTLVNPSGLDAAVVGRPTLIPGILNKAISIDCKNSFVRVSGPGHRHECFGDLDLCPAGYTLAFWINFDSPSDRETVYLSNGGHDLESHGVAMLYDRGNMQFRMRRKNGAEWRAQCDDLLPGRWYHVAVTWSQEAGLALYVNGRLVDTGARPMLRNAGSVKTSEHNEFVIGRANDDTPVREASVLMIDEFNFWSERKTPAEILALGPFYRYRMSMDALRGSRLTDSDPVAVTHGGPRQVPGKMGQALRLDGAGQYVDGGDRAGDCLGDLSLCRYGFTFAAWMRFTELEENMQYFSTGARGVRMYYRGGRLVAEAQRGGRVWRATWDGAQTGKWQFVELSWTVEEGLRMFVDFDEVAHAARSVAGEEAPASAAAHVYLGRDNGDMRRAKYGAVEFDDVELWNADRARLVKFGFLIRGRPNNLLFNFDRLRGNRLIQPDGDYPATVYGKPTVVHGRSSGALYLDGNSQYADFGEHPRACFGNLDRCRHGVTFATWMRPGRLRDRMEFLSTGINGLTARYDAGRLVVSARTSTRQWDAATDHFRSGAWQFVEISWSQQDGLKLFVDDRLVAQSDEPKIRTRPGVGVDIPEMDRVYIGRGDGVEPNTLYANATFDEVEQWDASREYLTAFGYIQRGKPNKFSLDMDRIRGGRLVGTDATVHGGAETVPGRVNSALHLDGRSQYVDVGRHPTSCLGNLRRCRDGQTTSMWAKFHAFANDMYYYAGGDGARVFYRNGKLFFVMRAGDREWRVPVTGVQTGKWYFLEYSWHPQKGLRVYIDNELRGKDTNARTVSVDGRVQDARVYVGRANEGDTDGRHFRYANATIDEVETWYADRDSLIAFGYIHRDNITHVYVPWGPDDQANHWDEDDGTLVHTRVTIELHGGARVIPTPQGGRGVRIRGGNEYASLGDQRAACMGNLDACANGLTAAFYLRPERFVENGYFLSSGPYSVYYRDGRVWVRFSTATQTWEVSTDKVELHKWQKMMMSWDPRGGLQLYVDGVKVDSTTEYRRHAARSPSDHVVYVGRPTDDTPDGRHGDFTLKELQFWYAYVDVLDQFNIKAADGSPWPTRPPPPSTTTAVVATGKLFTFDGRSWVRYEFGQLPADYLRPNDFEQFHIKFKTTSPTGLIWYSGTDQRNMHLSLNQSALVFWVDYTDDRRTITDMFSVRPGRGRLNDNQWHDVVITRRGRQLAMTVDGREVHKQLNTDIRLVNDGTVYVGGAPDPYSLTKHRIRYNFNGEVVLVSLTGDSLPDELDLMRLYWQYPRSHFVFGGGLMDDGRQQATRPPPSRPTLPPPPLLDSVTFASRRAFLRLPRLRFSTGGKIELSFRTTSPHGLLLYNGGRLGSAHFIALELYDGIVYLVMNLGGGAQRYALSATQRVDDGRTHAVKIDRAGRALVLTLDGVSRREMMPGRAKTLQLGTFLYVGGVSDPATLPWHLWTRGDAGKMFVGCVTDIRLNGDQVDLAEYVRTQPQRGLTPGCARMDLHCPPGVPASPCRRGDCRQRWAAAYCDCSATLYTGDRCQQDAPVIQFGAGQYSRLLLSPLLTSHTNDISVRFRTSKRDGLLLATSNTLNGDYLRMYIEGGQGKLETKMGGRVKIQYFCSGLSDGQWHTMYIRRRADHVESWVDDCAHVVATLPGDQYTLDIDQVYIAAMGEQAGRQHGFDGSMTNLIFDGRRFFELLRAGRQPPPVQHIDTRGEGGGLVQPDRTTPTPPSPGVTVTFSSARYSYVTFASLGSVRDALQVQFNLRTVADGGLLLFGGGEGSGSGYIAAELRDGYLYFMVDNGAGPRMVRIATPRRLNDGAWHSVAIRQSEPLTFELTVDGGSLTRVNLDPAGRRILYLPGGFHFGGVPAHLYASLPDFVESRRGFDGCLSALIINRRRYDFIGDNTGGEVLVSAGCSRLQRPVPPVVVPPVTSVCSSNWCSNNGVCYGVRGAFVCDCDMTSYVGKTCQHESEGYYFGSSGRTGILVYTYERPIDTDVDMLAFGFMTLYRNGTIIRIDSDISADYIEAKLENGHLVMLYDVGDGVRRLVETRRTFDDGAYHRVWFERRGSDATLRVDSYPAHTLTFHDTAVRLFNHQAVVKIGGKLDVNNKVFDHFDGIIAGVHLNGIRFIDMDIGGTKWIRTGGDIHVASHPFGVYPHPVTDKPPVVPPIVVVPTQPVVPSVAPVPPGPVPGPDPGPGPGPGPGPDPGPDPGPGPGPAEPPGPRVAAAAAGNPFSGASGEGARAGAVAGTLLGLLAAASSIMWAMYKMKPGALGGAGGAGGGKGGGGPIKISSPSTSNYQLVKTQSAMSSATGSSVAPPAAAPANYGGGTFPTNVTVTRLDEMNGATTTGTGVAVAAASAPPAHMGTQTLERGGGGGAGGGGGGASSSTFAEYFSSQSSGAVGAAGGGASGVTAMQTAPEPAPVVAAGGDFNAMTTTTTGFYQQDGLAYGAGGVDNQLVTGGVAGGGYDAGYNAGAGYGNTLASSSSAYNYSESAAYGGGGAVGYGGSGGGVSYGTDVTDQRMQTLSPIMFDANTLSHSAGAGAGGGYQMQNMSLNQAAFSRGAAATTGGGGIAGSVGGLAAEEIRVDCILLSDDAKYVVTGSLLGPPQVWDMRTGELVRIMGGDDLSSTDLHFACNGSLLVGEVAELTQVDPTDAMAASRLHHRNLQMWDFASGQALATLQGAEPCTASCLMNDGQRVVLGRTERYGGATTVVVWDALGNERVRELSYATAVGFADHVSHVDVSRDDRYVIAGFQNSYDGKANFVVFDLSAGDRQTAKVMALDASADCTVVLDNHEAVTGTRAGQLTVWSMRTGKALRQLVAPPSGSATLTRGGGLAPASAHAAEVTAVAIARNGKFLVSASADFTLKIWNLRTEKLAAVLKGHTDEVSCCAISHDDDMVVSGSKDGTIRLWKTRTGQAVSLFNTGIDIFTARISHDKRTIVALGDRHATRKLIMLRVVHTKTRSRAGSRCTSPLTAEPYE